MLGVAELSKWQFVVDARAFWKLNLATSRVLGMGENPEMGDSIDLELKRANAETATVNNAIARG